jgi:rSAM/selenodomain-associated transferase 2
LTAAAAPAVSFIIPALDEAATIAELLARLRRDFPGAELVVVDGGSSDDTVRRSLPLADLVLLGERGRALQMNLGAAAAAGRYLLFLHADTFPLFTAAALHRELAQQPGWGFCRVRLSGRRVSLRVVEFAMNVRSRLTAVATGDQMFLVRRDLFEAAGGFPPIPLMEDIALSKRLRRLGAPVGRTLTVVTSSRRWEQRGVMRTVVTMGWLRLLYVCGAEPQRLWRRYYG